MNQDKTKHWCRFPQQAFIFLCISVIVGLGYFSKDTLYVNGMPPWDASFYTRLVQDFYGVLSNQSDVHIGPYTIQRILPSGIIYHIFQWLQIPATQQNIVTAFSIFNIIGLNIIALIWLLISKELKISIRGQWLGVAFLFFNFAVLKHRTYDPILTDTTAFLIGILLFYFYLIRQQGAILITTALGAFVWPTAVYQGLLLLLLPPFKIQAEQLSEQKTNRWSNLIPILFPLAVALLGAVFIILLKKEHFATALPPFKPTFYVSIVLTGMYLFFALYQWLKGISWNWIKSFWSYCSLRYSVTALFAIGVFWGLKALQTSFASPEGFDYPPHQFLKVTFWVSVLYPIAFYISHIMYFGPAFVLGAFWWPQLVVLYRQWGLGIWACIGLAVFLSINSESRMLINFYPILIAGVVKLSDDLQWSKLQYVGLILLSLLISKVWFTIGPVNVGPEYHDILDNQRLFMNNGPAMSKLSYLIQTISALLAVAFVYTFYLKERRLIRHASAQPSMVK